MSGLVIGRGQIGLALKRSVIVCLVALLIGMSCVPSSTKAAVPVVAAGVAVGTFVGVVAIGAIAMDVMGYKEQSADTMAFAQATWMASEQWVKDQVMASYNAAVAAGDKTMAISADVRDWFIDHASPLVGVSGGVAKKLDVGEVALGNGESVSFPYQMYGLSLSSNQTSDVYYVAGGYSDTIALYYSSQWEIDNGRALTRIAFGSNSLGLPVPYSSTSGVRWLSPTLLIPATNDPVRARSLVLTHAGSVLRMTKADALGLRDQRDALRDSFPAAIPVPMPNDFVYTPVSNPGIDVHQKGDVLVDDAGKVYSPDQVQVKVSPKTQVVTDTSGTPVLDAAGNPVVAVPVGAVGVGAGAIPGTLVNVRTGEAVGDVSTEVPANPPFDWTSKPNADSSAAKLKSLVTTKFPFSLPWDFARLIGFLNATPIRPDIQYSGQLLGLDVDFHVDFAWLDKYIGFFRAFIMIGVLIGLIFAHGKLVGGAK